MLAICVQTEGYFLFFYFVLLHLTRLNCLRAYQRKLFQSRNSVRFSTLYSTAWVYTRGTWGFTSLKFAWLAPESSREVVFGSQELFTFWCSRKKNRAVKLYRDTEEYQKIADSINLKSLRFLLQDVSLKIPNAAEFTVAGSTCIRMFFWNFTFLFINSIFFFYPKSLWHNISIQIQQLQMLKQVWLMGGTLTTSRP